MSAALAQPVIKPQVTRPTCANCGQEFDSELQLWDCLECGQVRVWGRLHPADRALRPLLNCEGCEKPTRHGFIGVAGVTL